jgi:hypothetical protein
MYLSVFLKALCQGGYDHLRKQLKHIKGKVVPVHTMKAYRGSRGITPLILNLGTG